MTLKAVLKMGADGEIQPRRKASTFPKLTSALREYLQIVARMHRQCRAAHLDGFRFGSSEELVLETCKPVWANFDDMTLPTMRPKACFENAFTVAGRDLELRYTEGFALMDGSIPTHHGWLTGPDGKVEDPTWPQVYRRHADEQSAKRWSGRVVYMGIAVEREVHERWFWRTGYPNILAVRDSDIEEMLRLGPEVLR
jgi:hypothetical protein